MTVLKFGGTSVASKKSLETIYDIVLRAKNKKPVIIVSAVFGVTDFDGYLVN